MASMASPYLSKLVFLCLFLTAIISVSDAQPQIDSASLRLTADTLDWPSTMSLYNGEGFGDDAGEAVRRSLFWQTLGHYYISYGALSANRVPCPPRSGRSYYTHNCYKARGPAHPYTRGCSAITRCRR